MRSILVCLAVLFTSDVANALCFPPSKYVGEIQLKEFLEYLECRQNQQDMDIQTLRTDGESQQREIDELRSDLEDARKTINELNEAEMERVRASLREHGIDIP